MEMARRSSSKEQIALGCPQELRTNRAAAFLLLCGTDARQDFSERLFDKFGEVHVVSFERRALHPNYAA